MQLPPRVNIETIYHNQRTSGLSPRTNLKEEEEEKEEGKKSVQKETVCLKKMWCSGTKSLLAHFATGLADDTCSTGQPRARPWKAWNCLQPFDTRRRH